MGPQHPPGNSTPSHPVQPIALVVQDVDAALNNTIGRLVAVNNAGLSAVKDETCRSYDATPNNATGLAAVKAVQNTRANFSNTTWPTAVYAPGVVAVNGISSRASGRTSRYQKQKQLRRSLKLQWDAGLESDSSDEKRLHWRKEVRNLRPRSDKNNGKGLNGTIYTQNPEDADPLDLMQTINHPAFLPNSLQIDQDPPGFVLRFPDIDNVLPDYIADHLPYLREPQPPVDHYRVANWPSPLPRDRNPTIGGNPPANPEDQLVLIIPTIKAEAIEYEIDQSWQTIWTISAFPSYLE